MRDFFLRLKNVQSRSLDDYIYGYKCCCSEEEKRVAEEVNKILGDAYAIEHTLHDVFVDGQLHAIILEGTGGDLNPYFFIINHDKERMGKVPRHYILRALEYNKRVTGGSFYVYNFAWYDSSFFRVFFGEFRADLIDYLKDELENI